LLVAFPFFPTSEEGKKEGGKREKERERREGKAAGIAYRDRDFRYYWRMKNAALKKKGLTGPTGVPPDGGSMIGGEKGEKEKKKYNGEKRGGGEVPKLF